MTPFILLKKTFGSNFAFYSGVFARSGGKGRRNALKEVQTDGNELHV